ncbi:GGDEF domain-containing protein [Pseudolabrys sp. FHR47]|uniref:GGDEF domain-containing protein n=1 Tax=Pseudolabrys sp. FHR47 TaxID=2562284 RepID=UPI00143D6106|nr:GGDEF domain-containing protein [Pseudolabrys sp. FHR47]
MPAAKPQRAVTEDRPDAPPQELLEEVRRLRRDLVHAQERIAELEARADVDPLLDVLNRRGFERELTRSLAYFARYGTRAGLIFIDLDGFKPINDIYGHTAGDALLKAVAATLVSRVRASDVVARLGGDEFCVLMWNADQNLVAAKALDLEAIIAQARIEYSGANLSVGASAGGVALRAGITAAELIAEADRAMYARKKSKRG